MTRRLPFEDPLLLVPSLSLRPAPRIPRFRAFRHLLFVFSAGELSFALFFIEKLAPNEPYRQPKRHSGRVLIAARRLQVCLSLIELESFRLVVRVHPLFG